MQQPVFVNKSANTFSPKGFPMQFGQSHPRQTSIYTVKPLSPIHNQPKLQYIDPRQNRAPSVVSEVKPLTSSNFANIVQHQPKHYQVNQISMVSCSNKPQAVEKENNVNSLCKQFEPIAVKYNQLIRNLSILNPQLTQNQEITQTDNINFHSFVSLTPQKEEPNFVDAVNVEEKTASQQLDVYKIVNDNKEWQQMRVELSLKEGEILSLKEQIQLKDQEIHKLKSQPQKNNLEEYLQKFRAELEEKENIINSLSVQLCQANAKISQLQAEPPKYDNYFQREQDLMKEIEKLNKIVEYQDYEYPAQLQKQKYESDAAIDELMTQVSQLQQELYSRRSQGMYYQDFQEQLFYLKEENRKLNAIIRSRCQY